MDTDKFFETAAQECSRSDQLAPETWLDWDWPRNPRRTPALSGRKNQAEIGIRLLARGTGAAAPQKVALEVVKPDDPRLRILGVAPSEIELSPKSPRTATIRVDWVEEATAR